MAMASVTTITYQQRIDALRQTKKEHTELKRQKRGFYDIDDHGWIPWPEPIPFTPGRTTRTAAATARSASARTSAPGWRCIRCTSTP